MKCISNLRKQENYISSNKQIEKYNHVTHLLKLAHEIIKKNIQNMLHKLPDKQID